MTSSNTYIGVFMLTLCVALTVSYQEGNFYDYTIEHDVTNRLMGGQPAKRRQFPYMASICKKDQNTKKNQAIIPMCTHRCGASLISDQWLVTAAHCFTPYLSSHDLMVVAGTLKPLEIQSEQQFREVQKYIIHPKYAYKRRQIINDIALVQVIRPFEYSEAVTNVSIPSRGPRLAMTTSPGWGITSNTKTFEIQELQYLTVEIISNSVCNQILSSKKITIEKSQICTLPSLYENLCSSDAGSPLVQDNQLFGIISFSPQPCTTTIKDDTLPNIYTNVLAFRKFINRIVK